MFRGLRQRQKTDVRLCSAAAATPSLTPAAHFTSLWHVRIRDDGEGRSMRLLHGGRWLYSVGERRLTSADDPRCYLVCGDVMHRSVANQHREQDA